jgi:hypothetical protein
MGAKSMMRRKIIRQIALTLPKGIALFTLVKK